MPSIFHKFVLPLILMPLLLQSPRKNFEKMQVSQLIDDLINVDTQSVGLHPTAWAVGFVAEDSTPEFAGGVLGSAPPVAHPQIKELVKRGAAAVPELIVHLSDVRPTKLKVGGNFYMFQYFSDEYDPKHHNPKGGDYPEWEKKDFSGDYTVKVGDVCYAIIGQIVNRSLMAIRYQPTAGLVINSPIEAPEIIKKVKNDWNNITAEELKRSLIDDLEQADRYRSGLPAVKRLRYYFPDEYEKLRAGKFKDKIAEYEKEERDKK